MLLSLPENYIRRVLSLDQEWPRLAVLEELCCSQVLKKRFTTKNNIFVANFNLAFSRLLENTIKRFLRIPIKTNIILINLPSPYISNSIVRNSLQLNLC